jgi:hypothetical protein
MCAPVIEKIFRGLAPGPQGKKKGIRGTERQGKRMDGVRELRVGASWKGKESP